MNDIVKAENTEIIANSADFNIPTGFICTLDLTTIEGKLAVSHAISGAVSMRDKTNEVLRVTDFITKPGVRARTGEVCVDSRIICEDGTVYFSQSDGIAESIRFIVGIFTDPKTGNFTPLLPLGIGLKVCEQTLANGNTRKYLDPVKL